MIPGGIGINQIPGVTIGATVELCQEAERLGYTRCWASDQGLDTRDVFVTLTAIALKTQKMTLGTGITHPYTRHPAVTASGIASVNEISDGRAFLGLSAGGIDTLIPMSLERVKPLTAVREMVVTSRALFNGEVVHFNGQVVRMNGAHIDFGQPGIPIWIAGRGSKMISLGGELADGVLLDFLHKDLLQDYVDLVQTGSNLTGNKPRLCYSTMIVTNERVLEQVRPVMFWRLADSPPKVMDILGVTTSDVDVMRRTVATEGFAAVGKHIKDEWVEPFVIMGSIPECAAELARLMTHYHIDEFMLPILDMETAPELMAQVAKVLENA
jgi:5,10-methylenetetrahydromethanopterin reductase